MKKRILTLASTLILLFSALAVPVSAASAKDVYNYLVRLVKTDGTYDSDGRFWYDTMDINEAGTISYGVFYWESNQTVECSVFTDYYEVTLVLTPSMSLPFQAYTKVYDSQYTTGTVRVNAGYTGASYTGFETVTGNTGYKSDMLEILNAYLPVVLELTRATIHGEGYLLSDMGLTGYRICKYYHCFNQGVVTQEPTCTEDGVVTFTCTACGVTYTEPIQAPGHSWDESWVSVAPTCGERGTMGYACSRCGQRRYEFIPATGTHTWAWNAYSQEPTCTEVGVSLYVCAVCAQTQTVQDAPALGHAWKLTERLSEPGGDDPHSGVGLYTCSRCAQTKQGRLCASEVFTDMPQDGNWAHAPIDWAYFAGITSGKTETTFAPKDFCTRAQVVTFLWNAAGKPEPVLETNPFLDVPENKYYRKPVLWALENGITGGKTATSFAPNATCTRAEVVTFLWSAVGKPAPTISENPFTDVSEDKYYYQAVLWAVENGITGGKTPTTFGPKDSCTRAQIVTFLYKATQIPAPEVPVDFTGVNTPAEPIA